jgi:DNA topoisomerase-1
MESAERVSGERLLGQDPESGKNVYAKIGRYGPMVQMGEVEDEEKPRFAGLQKNQSINTITLKDALELFQLPRDLGTYEDKKVVASVGRFGPYISHNKLFVSIKEKDGDNPYTISLDRAIELIEQKKEINKNRFIAEFDFENQKIEVLRGPYGPYIKLGKKNFKIPKEIEPTDLNLESCLLIIDSGEPKGGKTSKPKTAEKPSQIKKSAIKKQPAKKKISKS